MMQVKKLGYTALLCRYTCTFSVNLSAKVECESTLAVMGRYVLIDMNEFMDMAMIVRGYT